MFKNYFKTAWRNLAKKKLFSLINIAGLSVGIAGCILIGLYIFNELSYDRFHKNVARIVRATTEYTVDGAKVEVGETGSMTGPGLASAFPEIESYVRIMNWEPYVVRRNEKTFVEKKFLFADSSFFKIFSFPLLQGDPATALDAPDKLVITKSMEKKYFGDVNAFGKILKVGGTTDYIVSGIAVDPPANSQIKFEFIASYASLPNANRPDWSHELYATYFLLHSASDRAVLEKKIPGFMKTEGNAGFLTSNDYLTYHLEPLTRVHLFSHLEGLEPNGNIAYVYILAAVAILILCIACVNYTNIATAQSVRRTSEIAIRKVLGSGRWQLFRQFIAESFLLNLFAFLIAIALVIVILPRFNQLVERSLSIGTLLQPLSLAVMALLFFIISVTSGAYPAFILSNLKLIKILKSGFSFSGSSATLRRSLIVFQFFVSVFLIISTIIILQQMNYMRSKDLGYNKEHIIVLPVDNVMRSYFQSFKESIERVPNVLSVSCGAEEITNIHWDDEVTASNSGSSTPISVKASPTDIDFVKTMRLHIVAGSDYTLSDWMQLKDTNDPHTSFMLNETLAKALGWKPEEAIGKTIYRSGSKGIVKAVVKDFNFASLHEPVRPLVIFLDSNYRHIFQTFIKVSGKNLAATVKTLGNVWKKRVPHRPFEYQFLDDSFNSLYHSEQQAAQIFSLFAGLAIILACLGLFALTAYTAVQRTKEIGIRKVLGASVVNIVTMLSKDFLMLVLIALFVAIPVSWWAANSWLQSFAYRISIAPIVFLMAGGSVILITLVTISSQAIKAATAKPVKSLRTE